MVLLAIWLILTGLLPLLNLRISSTVNMVLAVLAIAAGLLILLRRWEPAILGIHERCATVSRCRCAYPAQCRAR